MNFLKIYNNALMNINKCIIILIIIKYYNNQQQMEYKLKMSLLYVINQILKKFRNNHNI